MARKISNMFNTPKKDTRRTERGSAGYDNARENIDPHVRTQVVNTKEIVQDGIHYELSNLMPRLSFVVDPDGTRDYTSIQEALNALPATGGEIFVNAGTYVLTSTITIPNSNTSIRGAGASTLLDVDRVAGTVFDTDGNDNIEIEKLRIVSNDITNTNIGIHLNGSDRCIIRNTWLDTMEISIKVEGNYNTIEAKTGGGHGNAISVIWLLDSNYNLINNLWSEMFTNIGIDIENSDFNIVKSNIITSANNGIEVDATSNKNVLTDNTFQGITGTAIVDGGVDTQIGHNIT